MALMESSSTALTYTFMVVLRFALPNNTQKPLAFQLTVR
jgi:hypothetical protein